MRNTGSKLERIYKAIRIQMDQCNDANSKCIYYKCGKNGKLSRGKRCRTSENIEEEKVIGNVEIAPGDTKMFQAIEYIS